MFVVHCTLDQNTCVVVYKWLRHLRRLSDSSSSSKQASKSLLQFCILMSFVSLSTTSQLPVSPPPKKLPWRENILSSVSLLQVEVLSWQYKSQHLLAPSAQHFAGAAEPLAQFSACDICSQSPGPDCWYSKSDLPVQMVVAEEEGTKITLMFCAPIKQTFFLGPQQERITKSTKRRNWLVFHCKSTSTNCGRSVHSHARKPWRLGNCRGSGLPWCLRWLLDNEHSVRCSCLRCCSCSGRLSPSEGIFNFSSSASDCKLRVFLLLWLLGAIHFNVLSFLIQVFGSCKHSAKDLG